MQPGVQVRQEEPDDAADVRRLHRAAFGEEHGTVVAALVDDLRPAAAGACGLSLVAEQEGRVVGHVLFTRSLLDASARLVEVSVLSPLGVLPERQGEGIGSRLVREGLAVLAARAVPLVFLEGAPGYYSRLGFRPAVELGFRKPSLRIPDAAFQVARLGTDQPGLSGTLVYAHAFWDHDAVGLRDSPTTSGAAVVRKQYHFWPSSGGMDAWDVGRLIGLTAGLPPEQVALDDLPEIDEVYWFDDDWQRPTVRSIAEHVRLVRDVDTSWPIILGPDGRVMDGMHRVVRALLEGRATITAVRLPVLPEPDFRDCRPQDLPY